MNRFYILVQKKYVCCKLESECKRQEFFVVFLAFLIAVKLTLCADLRTKVGLINANTHKYPISAMCRVLSIPRSVYYYKSKEKSDNSILAPLIKNIFEHSRKSYGTRRIKFELSKEGHKISRRKISHIMKQEGLVSYHIIYLIIYLL